MVLAICRYQCFTTDAHTPRSCMHALDDDACRSPMSLAICVQTTFYAWGLWMMFSFVGKRRLADKRWPWQLSPNQCTYAMDNTCRLWLMLYVIYRCRLANARSPWLISPSQCTHATTDSCWTWIILYTIGRCRSVYAHMPLSMSPGWCPQSMTDVPQPMCTWHD